MKKLFKIISISLALLIFAVSSHAAKVSADAPAMSKIVKSGQLVLGTSGNQPPMTMLDKNGKPEGFDIDLADLMAQALGVKLVTKHMDFNKLLDALESGEVDATFLAMAGLNRLGITSDLIKAIDVEEFLPAVAQGAVGIEIKSNNLNLKNLLKPLNNEETKICVNIEREFLACFEGSCHTPLAAYAKFDEVGNINFRCNITKPCGGKLLSESFVSDTVNAKILAIESANKLKEIAGDNFFDV